MPANAVWVNRTINARPPTRKGILENYQCVVAIKNNKEGKKMANRKRRYSKRKSKYCDLERLAYNMGKVKRGLSNPNSRVYASYKNGCSGIASGKKKPLI